MAHGSKLIATIVLLGLAGSIYPASTGDAAPFAGFVTAPTDTPAQRVLLDVTVNGVKRGHHLVDMANGEIGLAPEELKALDIAPSGPGVMWLTGGSRIHAQADLSAASLALVVPPELMSVQRFGPGEPESDVRLSPEAWGAYVNYDVNVRRSFGSQAGAGGAAGFGGVADVRVLAPDFLGSFDWAYDSGQVGPTKLIRLDSTLTWRPASQSLAVSVGDVVSPGEGMGLTRPYRFLGFQIGTDFSGAPGWSAAPIASVNGSAQAQSALDLYLNGQRAYSTVSSGGPFSLALPAGVTAGGASLLVTDVTGRSVLIPVEVPRVDAHLLREGMFLWSAGAGAPQFGYATPRTTYAPQVYGYASGRYGAFERLTLRSHTEFGPGLSELEIGADGVVTPMIAVRATVAASRSSRGMGGAGRLGVAVAGPWGLNLDAAVEHTVGRFDDVVSVSGRAYSAMHDVSPAFTLPSEMELSARLSWQITERLGLASSYQANRYATTGTAGVATLSANYLVGNLPLFANAIETFGRHRSTSVLLGVSFQLGGVQGAASLGAGSGESGTSGFGRNLTGNANLSQPLRDEPGAFGWNLYGTRGPSGTFTNADAQLSTGYGIPGVAVQSFGQTTTGYATLRGSAGVVAGHPFISNPVRGGLIIVDADRSGVPVQLNGVDRGRTSFDGKLAISDAVAGAPQRVAIDATHLPLDAVPTATDGQVIVRDGGAAALPLRVQSVNSSARFQISLHGKPPPVGSTVSGASSSAPVGKDGQAYLPSIAVGEVLSVEMPDGLVCVVTTRFDGHGGPGRRLGTLPCQDVKG